jgi:hypothetical protein
MFSRKVLGWQVGGPHDRRRFVGSILLTPFEVACGVANSRESMPPLR